MQYVISPHHSAHMDPWVWWEDAFTHEELNRLQDIAKNSQEPASVGGNKGQFETDNSVRRSNVSWLGNSPENNWVYERLGYVVSKINADYYNFDLAGFGEALQMTNYNSENLGTYGWHTDFSGGQIGRKLSLVLQLTDPSQYEGGNLEVLTRPDPMVLPKKRGLIVCFPSWTLHRVTPVTMGTRQSLVTWITGNPFR